MRYTKKYWDTEPCKLSTSWIGARMRRSELKEVLYGAFTDDTPNTYYTKEMRYPMIGGFKAFIQPLIDDSDIRFDHEVMQIDHETREIYFKNGFVVRYKTLVSTIPLPLVIKILKNCPLKIIEASNQLKATSIDLISVGFNKAVVNDLWFYIYDQDIYASRAYSPSIKSYDNAPIGCSSLQFEIYSRGVDSKYKSEELIKNTMYTLKKLKICHSDDVLFIDHRRLDYGNVIFDTGMECHRAIVLDYLESNNIKSCGRFGKWDYLWSNQSFMSGYESL